MRELRRFRVGAVELIAVSDGVFRMDGGAVFGLVPRALWEPVVGIENIDDDHRIELGLNCVLVRSGEHIALIETGIGNKLTGAMRERVLPGDYGSLLDDLAAAGVGVEDVEAVANTHLHADHCGWNTVVRNGELVPTFPTAQYYIQKGEWEAANQPNERTRATYLAENFEPLQKTGQLHLAEGEQEIIPGVRFIPAPGHTADHAAVAISSQGETAIYLGDLVQHTTHIERPAWIAAFDVLPLVSLETKKRLAEQAIRDGSLLLATHAPYPGAGRLREKDGRRVFVPE